MSEEGEKVLVIGASTNPDRYAYRATHMLLDHGHHPVLLGNREGEVAGISIDTEKTDYDGLDTVTLYLGPARQPEYYDYLISLAPRRVIFNPGTENSEFQSKLTEAGIAWEEACTLVLLSTGQY